MQAKFDASELITQREVVSQKIRDELIQRADSFGLILDDISIVSSYSFNLLLFSIRCKFILV